MKNKNKRLMKGNFFKGSISNVSKPINTFVTRKLRKMFTLKIYNLTTTMLEYINSLIPYTKKYYLFIWLECRYII